MFKMNKEILINLLKLLILTIIPFFMISSHNHIKQNFTHLIEWEFDKTGQKRFSLTTTEFFLDKMWLNQIQLISSWQYLYKVWQQNLWQIVGIPMGTFSDLFMYCLESSLWWKHHKDPSYLVSGIKDDGR